MTTAWLLSRANDPLAVTPRNEVLGLVLVLKTLVNPHNSDKSESNAEKVAEIGIELSDGDALVEVCDSTVKLKAVIPYATLGKIPYYDRDMLGHNLDRLAGNGLLVFAMRWKLDTTGRSVYAIIDKMGGHQFAVTATLPRPSRELTIADMIPGLTKIYEAEFAEMRNDNSFPIQVQGSGPTTATDRSLDVVVHNSAIEESEEGEEGHQALEASPEAGEGQAAGASIVIAVPLVITELLPPETQVDEEDELLDEMVQDDPSFESLACRNDQPPPKPTTEEDENRSQATQEFEGQNSSREEPPKPSLSAVEVPPRDNANEDQMEVEDTTGDPAESPDTPPQTQARTRTTHRPASPQPSSDVEGQFRVADAGPDSIDSPLQLPARSPTEELLSQPAGESEPGLTTQAEPPIETPPRLFIPTASPLPTPPKVAESPSREPHPALVANEELSAFDFAPEPSQVMGAQPPAEASQTKPNAIEGSQTKKSDAVDADAMDVDSEDQPHSNGDNIPSPVPAAQEMHLWSPAASQADAEIATQARQAEESESAEEPPERAVSDHLPAPIRHDRLEAMERRIRQAQAVMASAVAEPAAKMSGKLGRPPKQLPPPPAARGETSVTGDFFGFGGGVAGSVSPPEPSAQQKSTVTRPAPVLAHPLIQGKVAEIQRGIDKSGQTKRRAAAKAAKAAKSNPSASQSPPTTTQKAKLSLPQAQKAASLPALTPEPLDEDPLLPTPPMSPGRTLLTGRRCRPPKNSRQSSLTKRTPSAQVEYFTVEDEDDAPPPASQQPPSPPYNAPSQVFAPLATQSASPRLQGSSGSFSLDESPPGQAVAKLPAANRGITPLPSSWPAHLRSLSPPASSLVIKRTVASEPMTSPTPTPAPKASQTKTPPPDAPIDSKETKSAKKSSMQVTASQPLPASSAPKISPEARANPRVAAALSLEELQEKKKQQDESPKAPKSVSLTKKSDEPKSASTTASKRGAEEKATYSVPEPSKKRSEPPPSNRSSVDPKAKEASQAFLAVPDESLEEKDQVSASQPTRNSKSQEANSKMSRSSSGGSLKNTKEGAATTSAAKKKSSVEKAASSNRTSKRQQSDEEEDSHQERRPAPSPAVPAAAPKKTAAARAQRPAPSKKSSELPAKQKPADYLTTKDSRQKTADMLREASDLLFGGDASGDDSEGDELDHGAEHPLLAVDKGFFATKFGAAKQQEFAHIKEMRRKFLGAKARPTPPPSPPRSKGAAATTATTTTTTALQPGSAAAPKIKADPARSPPAPASTASAAKPAPKAGSKGGDRMSAEKVRIKPEPIEQGHTPSLSPPQSAPARPAVPSASANNKKRKRTDSESEEEELPSEDSRKEPESKRRKTNAQPTDLAHPRATRTSSAQRPFQPK